MTFTLADLRYLLGLVEYDISHDVIAREAQGPSERRQWAHARRVGKKLMAIRDVQVAAMVDNYTTADQSNAITLGEFMVCIGVGEHKGGGTMAAKKVSKTAPKKSVAKTKGKIGKAVKKK